MLSILLKLLFIVVVARLLAGFLRLFRSPRKKPPQRPRAPQDHMPPHLGEDIVDADFEEMEKKP